MRFQVGSRQQFMPMHSRLQFVPDPAAPSITINVYPGPDRTYRLYQDDGISCDAENDGVYRLTEIHHQGVPGARNIRIRRTYDYYSLDVPEFPTITLVELRSRAESWCRVERPGGD
jgi:hypothetical protein